MTTNAGIGYGYKFRVYDDQASPPGLVTVAEVNNIKPPGVQTDAVEATHTESPGGIREFIAGLITITDSGFTANFIPNGPGHALIHRLALGRAAVPCQIDFGKGSPPVLWDFPGLISYEPDAPLDDKMTMQCTVKPTGVHVITNA